MGIDMRDNIGKKLFYLFLASVGLLLLWMVTVEGSGIDDPSGNAFKILVLMAVFCLIGALFLTSLIVGWHVRFVRYSCLGLIAVVTIATILNGLHEMQLRKSAQNNRAIWEHNDQIYIKRVNEFRPKLEGVKDPEQVEFLLKELNQKLDTDGLQEPPSRSEYGWPGYFYQKEYRELVWEQMLYLGIFVDPKYLQDERLHEGAYLYFYTGFLRGNLDEFTQEAHFINLFETAAIKWDGRTGGLHNGEQVEIAKILQERGYSEAFLTFVKFTKKTYPTSTLQTDNLWGLASILTIAKAFDEQQAAVETVIRHTGFNNFPEVTSECHTMKMVETYAVLKDSPFLKHYLTVLFDVAVEQCTSSEWFASYNRSENHRQFACFIANNAEWNERMQQVIVKTSSDRVRWELACD